MRKSTTVTQSKPAAGTAQTTTAATSGATRSATASRPTISPRPTATSLLRASPHVLSPSVRRTTLTPAVPGPGPASGPAPTTRSLTPKPPPTGIPQQAAASGRSSITRTVAAPPRGIATTPGSSSSASAVAAAKPFPASPSTGKFPAPSASASRGGLSGGGGANSSSAASAGAVKSPGSSLSSMRLSSLSSSSSSSSSTMRGVAIKSSPGGGSGSISSKSSSAAAANAARAATPSTAARATSAAATAAVKTPIAAKTPTASATAAKRSTAGVAVSSSTSKTSRASAARTPSTSSASKTAAAAQSAAVMKTPPPSSATATASRPLLSTRTPSTSTAARTPSTASTSTPAARASTPGVRAAATPGTRTTALARTAAATPSGATTAAAAASALRSSSTAPSAVRATRTANGTPARPSTTTATAGRGAVAARTPQSGQSGHTTAAKTPSTASAVTSNTSKPAARTPSTATTRAVTARTPSLSTPSPARARERPPSVSVSHSLSHDTQPPRSAERDRERAIYSPSVGRGAAGPIGPVSSVEKNKTNKPSFFPSPSPLATPPVSVSISSPQGESDHGNAAFNARRDAPLVSQISFSSHGERETEREREWARESEDDESLSEEDLLVVPDDLMLAAINDAFSSTLSVSVSLSASTDRDPPLSLPTETERDTHSNSVSERGEQAKARALSEGETISSLGSAPPQDNQENENNQDKDSGKEKETELNSGLSTGDKEEEKTAAAADTVESPAAPVIAVATPETAAAVAVSLSDSLPFTAPPPKPMSVAEQQVTRQDPKEDEEHSEVDALSPAKDDERAGQRLLSKHMHAIHEHEDEENDTENEENEEEEEENDSELEDLLHVKTSKNSNIDTTHNNHTNTHTVSNVVRLRNRFAQQGGAAGASPPTLSLHRGELELIRSHRISTRIVDITKQIAESQYIKEKDAITALRAERIQREAAEKSESEEDLVQGSKLLKNRFVEDDIKRIVATPPQTPKATAGVKNDLSSRALPSLPGSSRSAFSRNNSDSTVSPSAVKADAQQQDDCLTRSGVLSCNDKNTVRGSGVGDAAACVCAKPAAVVLSGAPSDGGTCAVSSSIGSSVHAVHAPLTASASRGAAAGEFVSLAQASSSLSAGALGSSGQSVHHTAAFAHTHSPARIVNPSPNRPRGDGSSPFGSAFAALAMPPAQHPLLVLRGDPRHSQSFGESSSVLSGVSFVSGLSSATYDDTLTLADGESSAPYGTVSGRASNAQRLLSASEDRDKDGREREREREIGVCGTLSMDDEQSSGSPSSSLSFSLSALDSLSKSSFPPLVVTLDSTTQPRHTTHTYSPFSQHIPTTHSLTHTTEEGRHRQPIGFSPSLSPAQNAFLIQNAQSVKREIVHDKGENDGKHEENEVLFSQLDEQSIGIAERERVRENERERGESSKKSTLSLSPSFAPATAASESVSLTHDHTTLSHKTQTTHIHHTDDLSSVSAHTTPSHNNPLVLRMDLQAMEDESLALSRSATQSTSASLSPSHAAALGERETPHKTHTPHTHTNPHTQDTQHTHISRYTRAHRLAQHRRQFDRETLRHETTLLTRALAGIDRRLSLSRSLSQTICSQWAQAQLEVSSTDSGVVLVAILPLLAKLEISLVPAGFIGRGLWKLQQKILKPWKNVGKHSLDSSASLSSTHGGGALSEGLPLPASISDDVSVVSFNTLSNSNNNTIPHKSVLLFDGKEHCGRYEYTLEEEDAQDCDAAAALHCEHELQRKREKRRHSWLPFKKSSFEEDDFCQESVHGTPGTLPHNSTTQSLVDYDQHGEDEHSHMFTDNPMLSPVKTFSSVLVSINAKRFVFPRETSAGIAPEEKEFRSEFRLEHWHSSLSVARHVFHCYDKHTGLLMIFLNSNAVTARDFQRGKGKTAEKDTHSHKDREKEKEKLDKSTHTKTSIRNLVTDDGDSLYTATERERERETEKRRRRRATGSSRHGAAVVQVEQQQEREDLQTIVRKGRYHFPSQDSDSAQIVPLALTLSASPNTTGAATANSANSNAANGEPSSPPSDAGERERGRGISPTPSLRIASKRQTYSYDSDSVQSARSNTSAHSSRHRHNKRDSQDSNRNRSFPRGLADERESRDKQRMSGNVSVSSSGSNGERERPRFDTEDRTNSPFQTVKSKKSRLDRQGSSGTLRSAGSDHSGMVESEESSPTL